MKQIDDSLLEQFKMLVAGHIGIYIRLADNESFQKTLIARMKNLSIGTAEEYLSFLRSDVTVCNEEWKALILLITTGESYFFRDKGHFYILKNTLLPSLIKNKEAKRSIRIWSAGCSTGEEPYSIAILLDMLLPVLSGWDISIVGSDINDESIRKAERGIYGEWSFRGMDKGIQDKYFRKNHDAWKIHEGIKKMVKFRHGNLLDDVFVGQNPELSNIDIILCRNVFIYFNQKAVSVALNKFLTILNNDGYLITGHGELHGQDLMGLRQIMYPEAVLYKKTLELRRQIPEIVLFQERIIEKKVLNTKRNFDIKPVFPVPEVKTIRYRDPKPEIEKLIRDGRYAEAVDQAESYFHASKRKHEMLYLMALASANAGDYAKAEAACRMAINIRADSPYTYFLLAHIAETKGNVEEAINCFNKAIYLDPAFAAAYCELGGLYEKRGDCKRATKARTAAIELLTSLPPRESVMPYDMTAGELLAYMKDLTKSDKNLQLSKKERVGGR